MVMPCLTDEQVSGVVLGTLSDDEMDNVSLHLESCPECETRLLQAEQLSDGFIDSLKRGLQSNPGTSSRGKASLQPGSVLGDYVVVSELGRGGMGTVYRATHTRMKRDVALKVVSPRAVSSPEAVRRFQREVEVVGRLSHPNIATAYDAREHDETFYLILEFVDGKDLSKLVRATGRLTVDQAVSHVLQAAKGLAYAHRRGVIHRDVKPANLMLDAEGTIKILDMGLSRLQDDVAEDDVLQAAPESTTASPPTPEVTQAGTMMGTFGFLAPEQALDPRKVDHRADIYSLGCTLFYLLVGRAPHPAETLSRTPLRLAGVTAPLTVENAVAKMLARQPEGRFASMGDVAATLEHHLRRKTQSSTRAVAVGSAVAAGLLLAAGVWYLGPWRFNAKPANLAMNTPPTTAPATQPAAPVRLPFSRSRAEELQKEVAAQLAVPATFSNSMGAPFSLIPPGEIRLDRGLIVPISRAYYVAKHELTVREFRRFADETGYLTIAETQQGSIEDERGRFISSPDYTWRSPGFANQTDDCPAVQLSYIDALAYCEWLSSKEGIIYRLPTQAEWEWAARAGAATNYLWGATDAQSGNYAWTLENSDRHTHPVGQLTANAWGLYDVHGNAAEWVTDFYDQSPPPGIHIDWAGPENGATHILCGSGFHNPRDRTINAYGASYPGSSHFAFGFRLTVQASALAPRSRPVQSVMPGKR